MARFSRAIVVAYIGAGDTADEADGNALRRMDAANAKYQTGQRETDPGVQVLADTDPGGGPCTPLTVRVADLIIHQDVLPEVQKKPSDA